MVGDPACELMGANLKAKIAAVLAVAGAALGVVANGAQLRDIVDDADDARLAMAEKAVAGQGAVRAATASWRCAARATRARSIAANTTASAS